MVALGQSNREIANALYLSVATVERHVANIFNKLDLRSRTQLGVWVAEHGLIAPDQS
jgi:DNA-binding NarL/FixJ family response regulator